MASLKLTNIEKAYGVTKVLKNINLEIEQGESSSLWGIRLW